ncbi:permease [Anaerocolumna sp. AGMB13025]|uniref:permease n=1 Tax=Anaerocolumna sp. AGMB13025 TaxID=3039116 RepID=UPI00241CA87C|nr:permease [Anaerocolumna sp. AGMB13025]WFR54708.1 permease [Anaerocolumna sp. AGMB13025]
MNSVFTYCLYLLAVILLILSFLRDKVKTKLALKKACKMFLSVLPQFLAILFLMGLLLTVFDSSTIQQVIGAESGVLGMVISSLVGAIALVPVLVAFPVAAELLKNGAGIIQIAVFISTLTTVGFVTLPLEAKYLGKKVAILRNALFFLFAFVVALIMGVVLT